jgi:hypothetical protein
MVEDTGIEYLKLQWALFEEFYRAPNARALEQQGALAWDW